MNVPISVLRITARKDGILLRTYRNNARGAKSVVGAVIVAPDSVGQALSDPKIMADLGFQSE